MEAFALVGEEVVDESMCKKDGDALSDAVGEEDDAKVNSQFSMPHTMF